MRGAAIPGFAAGQADADARNIGEQSNEDAAGGEEIVQCLRLRGWQPAEHERALHLAERREQCTQSFAVGGEPGTRRRRLPLAVGQRALRNDARRAADGPRAQHFDHLHEQLAAAEDEADARPGEPEELAERAQHDQVGRVLRAGKGATQLSGSTSASKASSTTSVPPRFFSCAAASTAVRRAGRRGRSGCSGCTAARWVPLPSARARGWHQRVAAPVAGAFQACGCSA